MKKITLFVKIETLHIKTQWSIREPTKIDRLLDRSSLSSFNQHTKANSGIQYWQYMLCISFFLLHFIHPSFLLYFCHPSALIFLCISFFFAFLSTFYICFPIFFFCISFYLLRCRLSFVCPVFILFHFFRSVAVLPQLVPHSILISSAGHCFCPNGED